MAVVRLHGRNRDTWEKKGLAAASDRFNYLYTDDELNELAQPIRSLAENAHTVHVLAEYELRRSGPGECATLASSRLCARSAMRMIVSA